MARVGRPRLDLSIRYSLAENVKKLRQGRGLSYEALQSALKQEGVAINQHTLRAWERTPDQQSSSRPSMSHIVALAKVFDVQVDTLLGLQPNRNHGGLYEVMRRPVDDEEEKTLDIFQNAVGGETHPVLRTPLHGGETTQKTPNDNSAANRRIFRSLLFSNLIHVDGSKIEREATLEAQLKRTYPFLREVCVFDCPGTEVHCIRDFFFVAAAAHYFEAIAARCTRIGLAGGSTIAGMMHLTRRGHLNKLELFPMLRTDSVLAAATFSSAAIVSAAYLKHEDFGLSVPENLDKAGFFESYLKTADALFFSPGNNLSSSLIRVLRSFGWGRERFYFLVGDVLFNPLTSAGETLAELDTSKLSAHEKAEALEVMDLLESPRIQQRVDSISLELVGFHAQQYGLHTVALACGVEKQAIIRAMLARSQPVCNVLITDRETAIALLASDNLQREL